MHVDNFGKVSVVIPVYNCQEFLNECLSSVLDQSYQDIEVILVDDGSTDSSGAIAGAIAQRDTRLSVVSQRNKGVGAARNAGIARATGKWLMFVDADDELATGAIRFLVKAACADRLDQLLFSASCRNSMRGTWRLLTWLKTREQKMATSTHLPGIEAFTAMVQRGVYSSSPVLQLLSRDFLVEHAIQFPERFYHEDLAFTLACTLRSRRTLIVDEALYIRRFRPESITTAKKTWNHLAGMLFAVSDVNRLLLDALVTDESILPASIELNRQLSVQARELLSVTSREEIDAGLRGLLPTERAQLSFSLNLLRATKLGVRAGRVRSVVRRVVASLTMGGTPQDAGDGFGD